MSFKSISKFLENYPLHRFKNLLFLSLANLPMPGHTFRPILVRWGGVKIKGNKSFIGKNVVFDTVAPERIYIGKECVITEGVILLSHYQDSKTGKWSSGDVLIGDHVFIGARSIITKSLTIGDNAMIGAGSVVTKDIPANEAWAGNPARFIRKRELM